jgi:hypothetical protein
MALQGLKLYVFGNTAWFRHHGKVWEINADARYDRFVLAYEQEKWLVFPTSG